MRREPVIQLHPLLEGQIKEALDDCQQILCLAGGAPVAGDLEEANPVRGIAEPLNEFRTE
jgi:hypothetical protein